MKEPVDHIARPQLPWRASPPITECGLNSTKCPTISRVAYFLRLKDMGRQRTALMTCVTCSDTAARWRTWEEEPREAIMREAQWEDPRTARKERGNMLLDELIALAALVEVHREEFNDLVAKVSGRREWLAKGAAIKSNKPIRKGDW